MWRRKAPSERPEHPIAYPDGVAVETESGVYYIKGGKKYRFTSDRVLGSWGLRPARGSEVSVSEFPTAKTVMGFRDGTLVLDFEDNTLWVISNLRRRKITSPDWMDRLSLSTKDAIVASAKEVALHLEGDDLS